LNFFKRYYETIKSLAIIIGAVLYLHHYMDEKFSAMEVRLEGRLTRIETILFFQGMRSQQSHPMVHSDQKEVQDF
jgi:hypothetical protein